MDRRTVQYYDDNAEAVYARHNAAKTGVSKYFNVAFPPGSEVLDIGAGSGRDMGILMREPHDVYGVEPSESLRQLAVSNAPELAGRFYSGSLPGLSAILDRQFDGILCSAVFMHIPEEEHFDAACEIRNLLKPHGRLLLSVPRSRPDLDAESRDQSGRLFTPVVPESLELLFERLGLQRIGKWEDDDSLGRQGRRWTTLLFERTSDQIVRPMDQIEGVLNRDRKFATYKLALFRALCEIALTRHHLAKWRPDGSVAIPVLDIAERWIYYYWPLFEDESVFIPQMRGESQGGVHPVAFRPLLQQLISRFRQSGGLDAFAVSFRSDSLRREERSVLEQLSNKLVRTIVEGPVTYAGGSLETGRLFSYDRKGRHVIVGGEIWREFSLAGHWIQDALILRWSELTSEISRGVIKPSEVVDRLLRSPTHERNVVDARRVYEGLSSKECVWSGASLRRKFEVDHVLPFSLWRNNDLWNLLPADPVVNREKKDSLPTNTLLKSRRDVIMVYWDLLWKANPVRFEHEVHNFSGLPKLDLPRTFSVMLEAVEVTALQRGCLRWPR